MEITSDDDLEVATVLAKGLGQGLGTVGLQKIPESTGSGRQSMQSPRRSSTVLTNHSRGNTATTTPSAVRNGVHQMAACGELLMLQQCMDESQVEEVDENGLTPLLWASMYGQADVVHFLLGCGARPNVSDPRGVTSIMMACYHGNVEVVKILLRSKIDLDITDEDGNTALCYAVFGNHAECVSLLLHRGADLTVRNYQQNTAMDAAIKLQHKQVQKTIEQYLLKCLDGS